MTVTEIRSCEITPYILLLKAIISPIDLQSRCTLASMMLTLYLIPRKRAEPWWFFLAAIEEQLPVGVQNVHAKNIPVSIDVNLLTLNILILPNLLQS